MDDVTFEKPTFDPDGPGEDDDFDLPDPPMEPPLDVQQLLNASGDNLQGLQEELREAELEAQKKRLVDSFYNEVSHTYWLRPEDRIDYSQSGIDPDGKTLYWTPEDRKISIAATRGKFQFLGLDTLARRYGAGDTYVLRRSLGLPDYRSGASRGLGREVVETLKSAEETLPKNIEAIELKDLSGVADTTSQSVEDVETALKTINGPQIDVAWVTQAAREFAGVKGAMTRVRDELANNLVKLSDAKDQKSGREAPCRGAPKTAALRTQFNRIRDTIGRHLHEDKTLAERIRTLFREQGITIASILTAIGMAISTLVLALTGGGSAPVPSPTPRPPDKGGVKDWVKKHLQALGRAWPIWPARLLRPCPEYRLNRLLAPEHVREGRDLAR